jgi:hypothetical protein
MVAMGRGEGFSFESSGVDGMYEELNELLKRIEGHADFASRKEKVAKEFLAGCLVNCVISVMAFGLVCIIWESLISAIGSMALTWSGATLFDLWKARRAMNKITSNT